MKKFLAMLPLVAVLAGCSASMRSGASVYVVREPSVFPAYSWSYAGYGCSLPPLHAWIGLGWMNPFCYYGFYMHYCSQYGAGDFAPEAGGYRGSPGMAEPGAKGAPKAYPRDALAKTRRAHVAEAPPSESISRGKGMSGRVAVVSPAPGRSENRGSSSRGSPGRMESKSGAPSSRASAVRSEKSSANRKKK